MSCRHCGTAQPITSAPASSKEDYRALVAASEASGARSQLTIVRCAACGAETSRPAKVISENCAFCGGSTVSTAVGNVLRPAGLLAFKLDAEQARSAVASWAKNLWFLPAGSAPSEKWDVRPIFLPYWSFDLDVSAEYEGQRGIKSGKRTDWTSVSGKVEVELKSATVFGSRTVSPEHGADLEPWDSENIVAYDDDYLRGVYAESSAISVARAGELAHRLLDQELEYRIDRDIGGDDQRILKKTITYRSLAVHQVLMPIWLTRFGAHRVMINARSGEVIGERPVSRAKIWAAFLAPIVLAALGATGLEAWSPEWGFGDLPVWRAWLTYFWGVLAAIGLIGFLAGSIAAARAPSARRQFSVSRPGPGSTGLLVDPAQIWQGVLQDDPHARAVLIQVLGFAAMFVSLFPALATASFDDAIIPMIMSYSFSGAGVAVFVWAARVSIRNRRRLLGTE